MKLLIHTDGKVLDFSYVAAAISLKSSWANGASKLTFRYPQSVGIMLNNGDYVVFEYNEVKLFAGTVFTIKKVNGDPEITAYDQLRYFKAKDTIMRKNKSLSELLDVCAGNLLVTTDVAAITEKLPNYLFENQTYLDMIYQSCSDHLMQTGYYYVLRDNAGKVELKEIYDLRVPVIIGDESLAYNYDYEKSIDSDTYNQIKLAKDNEDAGQRDVYIVRDTSLIQKWGMLQYFEKVDGNLNESQIKERADRLIKLKKRETEKLKIPALGDSRVMGGSGVRIVLVNEGIDAWAIVDSVTHTFTPVHTMELSLVFERS